MEIGHDRCGAPTFRLASGTWIHALPATVYHVERFIWETAPEDFSEILLGRGERPRPHEVEPQNASGLWARHLTSGQSIAVARWLGGRIATRSEWQEALAVWGSKAYASALQPSDSVDARIGLLIERLRQAGVSRRSNVLPATFSEFATEHRREPFGTIHLLSETRAPGVLTGAASRSFRDPDAGFTCVFDERQPRG